MVHFCQIIFDMTFQSRDLPLARYLMLAAEFDLLSSLIHITNFGKYIHTGSIGFNLCILKGLQFAFWGERIFHCTGLTQTL